MPQIESALKTLAALLVGNPLELDQVMLQVRKLRIIDVQFALNGAIREMALSLEQLANNGK